MLSPLLKIKIPPYALFSAPTHAQTAEAIQADASATYDPNGSIVSYQWSATNGQQKTGKTVSFTFDFPGIYTITLTVTDDEGAIRTASKTITVTDCSYSLEPASVNLPSAAASNGSVKLNATGSGCGTWNASSNVDWIRVTSAGSGTGSSIVTYSVEENLGLEGRSGMLAIAGETFSLTQAGAECVYTIDPLNRDHTANEEAGDVNVQVSNPACSWAAISNAPWLSIKSGQSGTGNGLIAYSTTANTGLVERTGTLSVERHTFTVKQNAPTQNQPPIASFTATPNNGPKPLKVILNYSASHDPDGQIVSYAWQINGVPVQVELNGNEKYLTLSSAGTYTITLTVTDNDGLTGSAQQTVTVTEPDQPPPEQNQPPVVSLTATPTQGTAPLKVLLTYSASDSDGQVVGLLWKLNGTPIEIDSSASEKSLTFNSPGTYVITLTATDDDGASTEAQQTVIVGSTTLSITPNPHNFGNVPVLPPGNPTNPFSSRRSVRTPSPDSYAEGRVIVKFQSGVTENERAAIRARYQADLLDTVSLLNGEIWQVDNVQSTLDAYAQATEPAIEYIEPDYLIAPSAVPNDPNFSQQWGYDNDGKNGGSSGADISATQAWDKTQGGGVCAVLDTGVDYNHPDLKANLWRNPGEIPGDGIDNDGNGYVDDVYGYNFLDNNGKPMDDYGHGTHVAGTIAAVGNNGVGVTGVNWSGKVMALKIFDGFGNGGISEAIRALDYAAKMGVKCTNNSWRVLYIPGFNDDSHRALFDSIDAFGRQGGLFIAASGNNRAGPVDSDRYPAYPGAYDLPNIINVCASDRKDELAYFSYYGSKSVDLCAPGAEIFSTLPGQAYDLKNGTSMAAPHVAGAVAMLWAQYPMMTPYQIKAQLIGTIDVAPKLEGLSVTGGRLNLAAVLNNVIQPQTFTVTNTGTGTATISQPNLSNSADFRIYQNTCGNTLNAGASCTVMVTFNPETEGDKQATLSVSSATASLSGTATMIKTSVAKNVRPVSPAIFQAEDMKVIIPSVVIEGDSSPMRVNLCMTESILSVCGDIGMNATSLQAEDIGHTVFDPASGIADVPFVQIPGLPEDVNGGVDGYSAELELIPGTLDFTIKKLVPIW